MANLGNSMRLCWRTPLARSVDETIPRLPGKAFSGGQSYYLQVTYSISRFCLPL